MKKYIYKITNNINKKSYIGQTTDYKRRFQEHKMRGYGTEKNKTLYKAFDKYGVENFSFEILESDVENYNEREIYWIQYYDSYFNGYNETMGGDEPPLNTGEKSPFATHSFQEVQKVVELILNSTKTFKEIAKETNYDESAIKRINQGKIWKQDNLDYPLRKETSRAFQKDRAEKIKFDLIYTKLTQKEIAKKYGCARSTVTMINSGKNNYDANLIYPLRKY